MAEQSAAAPRAATAPDPVLTAKQIRRMKRFDNPWRNPKLVWGAGLLLSIILLGLLGRMFWDAELVFTGAGLPRQAPLGFENIRGQVGTLAHPLGTEARRSVGWGKSVGGRVGGRRAGGGETNKAA